MIALVPLSALHYAGLDYTLSDVQGRFSALPKAWFDNQDDTACKIVICHQGVAVGFFVLDTGQDRAGYSNNPQAVLLRSMSINPIYQGKGYAKQALNHKVLRAFCQKHLPDCNQIVLGVNHANITAQKLYQSRGFVRTQRIFMGKKGVQLIYELVL